jgi:two-component system response regulator GlrR
MEEGRFREDLFYRLNVANITPPLSARSETSPAGPSGAGRLPQPSPRLRRPRLLAGGAGPAGRRGWPGNVRQLCGVVEQLASLCCSR